MRDFQPGLDTGRSRGKNVETHALSPLGTDLPLGGERGGWPATGVFSSRSGPGGESPTRVPPAEDDLSLSEVLKTRKYWCVLGARASADAAWYFYLFWIPGYFQDVRRFDLASVGRFLWIPFFSAGVGALAGAWASSGLIRRGLGLDRSRKTILFASASLCVVGASACFAPAAYLALALVSLALFGHQSFGSNIHTVITEITPPGMWPCCTESRGLRARCWARQRSWRSGGSSIHSATNRLSFGPAEWLCWLPHCSSRRDPSSASGEMV